MMELSQLEQDLIGDLGQDTHGIWEDFEFVKLHHPSASDDRVFAAGFALLQQWAERDWIVIASTPLKSMDVSSLAEALSLVGSMGAKSLRHWEGAPSIDLSDKALEELAWLR